jgi:hypothetical protein
MNLDCYHLISLPSFYPIVNWGNCELVSLITISIYIRKVLIRMEPCHNGQTAEITLAVLAFSSHSISIFHMILVFPRFLCFKCGRHFGIMFVCLFLQGSLSTAASIHKEEPGNKWRFMHGVFILIWQDGKTKYLTIQVPCTCINFK